MKKRRKQELIEITEIKGENEMQERTINNNAVTIIGEIVSEFFYSHELYGEKFFESEIKVERMSGVADIIPITVSERLLNVSEYWSGRYVKIEGQFRSRNLHDGNRKRLCLSVFVKEIEELPFMDDKNHIVLDGFICKEPVYRETPRGREITDLLVAVNRAYGKSDYIPCVVWGRNARFASCLTVGTHISLEGRVQSREYLKRLSETESETRVAYEVSVSSIETIEETEDNDEHEEED